MKSTGEYVIFRESRDDFFCGYKRRKRTRRTGWHEHPQAAQHYDSVQMALKTAQELASLKGCKLTVCEVAESETQIALSNPIEVWPF